MMKTAIATAAAVLLAAAAAADDDDDDDDDDIGNGPIEVKVDCDQGDTITDALTAGKFGSPLIIIIRGTCVENITITRDDVTLRGLDPGLSRIVGAPNPGIDENPVSILGAERTIIERLTISGGQNVAGIGGTTGFFTIRDCIVEDNDRFGILVAQGAHGRIDSTIIRRNGQDGIIAFGGFARIYNSEIRENAGNGIRVANNGKAAIGIAPPNLPGPNTIESNGGEGIQVDGSSHARIDLNTIASNADVGVAVTNGSSADVSNNRIESNGATGFRASDGSSATLAGNLIASNNAIAGFSSGGIGVNAANIRLTGANEVRENIGHGILVIQGSLTMDGGAPADLIELNSNSGVRAEAFSTLTILEGNIGQNGTDGIQVVGQSYLVVRNMRVQDNSESGIRIRRDSGVRLLNPPAIVSGHTFFDLECMDLESSVEGVFDGITVIDPACTGF